MKVIVVEDDGIKRAQIVAFIRNRYPDIRVVEKGSYQSGMKEISKCDAGLVLLDMTMPTFDLSPEVGEAGGRPRAFAGKEILRQMHRRRIKTPVIIVTQFDTFGEGVSSVSLQELCDQIEDEYPSNYRGCVYYNPAVHDWKPELASLMDKFCR